MIPLSDDQPRFSTPFVNYFLIAVNLLIFFGEASLPESSLKTLLFQFGLIPSHVLGVLTGAHHLSPIVALVPLHHLHVSARLMAARRRKHAVLVDFR
jgi:hypothetical protein